MSKKQYIAPISEKVFPETIMWNPGSGGIIQSGSNIQNDREIVAPIRKLYV